MAIWVEHAAFQFVQQGSRIHRALWVGLTRFLTNPKIPLDNNGSERDARLAGQGRKNHHGKNHHGSKSKRGTEVAAILYTWVESAKPTLLDPNAYLLVVVTRALRGESALLPNAVELDELIAAALDRNQATRALARRTATACAERRRSQKRTARGGGELCLRS